MASFDFSGMTPKSGHSLHVLMICRVSSPGPGKQDIRSLDDQENMLRAWIKERYTGPTDVRVIRGTGSGERLNRKELFDASDAVENGDFDLVLCEDLGRIMRRMEATTFCEAAEDSSTRVIAVNDGVDTADDHWRMNAIFASMRHEMYNGDTSKRIRRSHRNRFMQGGVVGTVIYGYIKPPGSKTDDELQKDSSAEAIYDEWFTRLENGQSFSRIADWLNESGVPPGPYSRTQRWTHDMVGRISRNPILKGVRERNRRVSKRINKTGERKSVKAPPEELLQRECPHLAFIDAERFDRVSAMLEERNACYSRVRNGQRDVRAGISKKKTRFPGQCVYCGICGEMYVFGASGERPCLLCRGALHHTCWNGISVDAKLAVERICDAVFEAIENLADFDAVFIEHVQQEYAKLYGNVEGEIRNCEAALAEIERGLANVTRLVRDGIDSTTLREELAKLERDKVAYTRQLTTLRQRRKYQFKLPTVENLKEMAIVSFRDLARDSYDFGDKMRALVPRIVVFPYRLCDGGKPVLKARFVLRLASLCEDHYVGKLVDETLNVELEVDLFDPPQREQIRRAIAVGGFDGMKQREIGEQLGVSQAAVSEALLLQRRMDESGLAEAYQPLDEPPTDQAKLRRHKHKNYKFKRRPDAGEL